MKYVAVLLLITSFNVGAQDSSNAGDFFLALSGIYYTDNRTRTTTIDETNLIYDLRAGYGLGSYFFAGLHFEQEEITSKTSGYTTSTLNDTVKLSRRSYGPMVGYVREHFYAFLTYIWSSEWKVSSQDPTNTYLGGSTGAGYQFDLG